ncbi:MAG: MMPL family transporter [Deltaproteobacteria bacterium]|nr:MMPL family transporter [Deltaproteobacteria bacterium]
MSTRISTHDHDPTALHTRALTHYANFLVKRPGLVLGVLLALGVAGTYGASKLTINSNQLDLISKELPEVKAVQRIIDMVGGTGHLILALRSDDEVQLKSVADDLAAKLTADTEYVRKVTYKVPVDFFQENMVLFVQTEDLVEGIKRVRRYLKDQIRRNNPFFFELTQTEPVKLDLSDLVAKYNHVGKKSIVDDYYISIDRKMQLLLLKPMWDSNDLGRTKELVDRIDNMIVAYSKENPQGIKLVEDYKLMGTTGTVAYGYTGSYKTNVDDSYAIIRSLEPVTLVAFLGIFVITLIFFRRIAPSLIVITGTALGTILTMGFTYATVGQLNMITSVLGGILMGFGVDYGIHFTYRTRIELGAGKPYDRAVRDALVFAGRPASVAAVVTGGSFLVLMASEFRGFSQFGFLAGVGTVIIGVTLFSFVPALLTFLGRRWPSLPERLIGRMDPPKSWGGSGELRVPRPGVVLSIAAAVVAGLCAFAIPWTDGPAPVGRAQTMWERLKSGVRFNYNTRALMPEDEYSVQLQDEINSRYQISSDPTAVYTKTIEEAKEVWDELTNHPEKYPTIDQVVSMYSFVPEALRARKNVEVLADFKRDFGDIDPALLPEALQAKVPLLRKILDAQPFDVTGLPDGFTKMFTHLPTAKPENHGYLTFIYPRVDLWDGKQMIEFADQTGVITTASGREYRSAGLPNLFAKLARIVLWDGKVTVILVTIWILAMHFWDFRSIKLAAASVIPLGVGLVMMLGIMSATDHRLNFMNIIILPILLGFGVSHGLYLLHRFLEGTSPIVAFGSVGAAVASSTLTAIAGFGSLMLASHNGLKSMGWVACIGLTTTLVVSFTVLAAVLQILHDARTRRAEEWVALRESEQPPAAADAKDGPRSGSDTAVVT